MLDALGDKLEQVFKRLRGHGRITERHMTEALREVRMALLEADVALPVVKQFTEAIREQALGQEVLQSLTPEQHLIKFIHSELIKTMGETGARRSTSACRRRSRSCWSACRARARRPAPPSSPAT